MKPQTLYRTSNLPRTNSLTNSNAKGFSEGGVEEDVSLHQHTVDLAMRHSTQQGQALVPHLIPHFLQQTALWAITSYYEVHLSGYKNGQNTLVFDICETDYCTFFQSEAISY